MPQNQIACETRPLAGDLPASIPDNLATAINVLATEACREALLLHFGSLDAVERLLTANRVECLNRAKQLLARYLNQRIQQCDAATAITPP
jgi:hypothetical protein